ncbi:MAG TPA: TetR/AcrR family transcriptional regulator [Acidimicrobiales bacterium]|jgi:AcrR family transcriptional regulator|nr:TetR/AcrR family transcriptional regulator [Acidimicrobiales bacterium]
MSAPRTIRARARAELTTEIKDAARRQLAEVGAPALSLRAVARSLGMVPSALYRYFASRDHLLTALIVDGYLAVGEAAEAASIGRPREDLTARWLDVAAAIRRWALEHPNEWALLYGSPVPGYRAPRETVEPALRVTRALAEVFTDAHTQGRLQPPLLNVPVPDRLTRGLEPLRQTLLPGVPEDVAPRAVMAWTQIMGSISLELFGHFEGGVVDLEAMFLHGAAVAGVLVGLPTGLALG